MATQVLADIASVIPIDIMKQTARQMNRKATTLSILPKEFGTGKNLTWDVRFSRATLPATFTEGADMVDGEFLTDPDVLATLNWGFYRTGFKLSTLAVNAAMTAQNAPDAISDLFQGHLEDAVTALAVKINTDTFSGAGTTGLIAGLTGGGAVDSTGTYAGIAQSSYAEWASTELANGAVLRPLTKDLIDQCEQQVYDSCGESPDLIVGSSSVIRKYEGLFDQNVRFARGTSDLAVGQPNALGFSGYTYKGIPVYRDRNSTANTLFMLNRDEVKVCILPEMAPGMQVTPSELRKALTDTDGSIMGIPVMVRPLAMTGDAYKFEVSVHLQVKVRRRNAHGKIVDIAV